jgi:hypothetical protein
MDYPKKLEHTNVEMQITKAVHTNNVQCNVFETLRLRFSAT